MAETPKKKRIDSSLIDPIYEKFTRGVIRAIGSTDFYEFFMDAVSKAENEFQFSNRKMEKYIDLKWIDAIEDCLEGFQNIIENPRNIIREEELIVNVAHAKKAGSDVVRHLAQHGALMESFDEETGDVRPEKLMQKFREDSTELYENRLAYTVLENAFHFVRIRHNALTAAMSDEFGAKLKVQSHMESATEDVYVDMYLHIKEKDSLLETDDKNGDTFARISRLYRLLSAFMNTDFAEQFSKLNRVKGNIMKTNVLKKNPNYKKIVKLWEFLHQYEDVGYIINITEQNPQIDEKFQRDIYHNILFQYMILKGYLEDEKDRQVPAPLKQRKRKLKPKIIRQIIEELTEDYDIPDVEIRKVLIEELTREDLMKEESAERWRLLEEMEERLQDEEERLRLEKEAEERRLQEEASDEEERLRLQQEEEEKQRRIEQIKRDVEDRRRSLIFRSELEWFESHKAERMELRVAEKKLKEARERERLAREMAILRRYQRELDYFASTLSVNKEARAALIEAKKLEEEALQQAKEERQQKQKKSLSWTDRWRNSRA